MQDCSKERFPAIRQLAKIGRPSLVVIAVPWYMPMLWVIEPFSSRASLATQAPPRPVPVSTPGDDTIFDDRMARQAEDAAATGRGLPLMARDVSAGDGEPLQPGVWPLLRVEGEAAPFALAVDDARAGAGLTANGDVLSVVVDVAVAQARVCAAGNDDAVTLECMGFVDARLDCALGAMGSVPHRGPARPLVVTVFGDVDRRWPAVWVAGCSKLLDVGQAVAIVICVGRSQGVCAVVPAFPPVGQCVQVCVDELIRADVHARAGDSGLAVGIELIDLVIIGEACIDAG